METQYLTRKGEISKINLVLLSPDGTLMLAASYEEDDEQRISFLLRFDVFLKKDEGLEGYWSLEVWTNGRLEYSYEVVAIFLPSFLTSLSRCIFLLPSILRWSVFHFMKRGPKFYENNCNYL